MIAVTGATGHVGGLVAGELARRGLEQRLVVRDPARAPEHAGATVAVADYGDRDALVQALTGCDAAFMVSLHQPPDRRVQLHGTFIEAAAASGVGHVVYLSFSNAGPEATFLHARSHGATEKLLRESGTGFTFIRNGMYGDYLHGWFDAEGVAREPVGEGRISFSYRPELAEAIAVTLTKPGHQGKTYDVNAEPVGLAELARTATDVTGRPHSYEPLPRADWETRWRAKGTEEWEIEAGLTSFDAQIAGELDIVSEDFRQLTGRAPLTVAELVERTADQLVPSDH